MSTLPRHVVVDLIPLYVEGELSAETKSLVDAYLATDGELLQQVHALRAPRAVTSHVEPRPDAELAALRRTRRTLVIQRWLFSLAIAFMAIGFSVQAHIAEDGAPRVRLMIMDYPVPFGACLAASVVCWMAYRRSRESVRM